VWHHVLATLVVFAAVATLALFATLVFGLVFLFFDEPSDELSITDFVAVLAHLVVLAASVSLFTLVLGLIFDRLTSSAPALVRYVAPAMFLPLAGGVFLAAGWDTAGVYTLELGILFCLYWAVFLLQELLIRLLRRVWARVWGSARTPTRNEGWNGASTPSDDT
jgi:amino acid transporter